MARNYDLDTAAAKEAGNGGKRINDPGAYSGRIKAAYYAVNDKGTESVNIQFASDEGQEVTINLYTHNGRGDALPSFKTLNAIMCCMRVKKLIAAPGNVTIYDHDTKKDVTEKRDCYAALINPVGLVLQAEEYRNDAGETKLRMVVAAAYEASSKFMAEEILGKATEAKSLAKFLEWFEAHKIKRLKGGASQSAGSTQTPPAGHPAFDDSVPF